MKTKRRAPKSQFADYTIGDLTWNRDGIQAVLDRGATISGPLSDYDAGNLRRQLDRIEAEIAARQPGNSSE